jgi:hypothetical protein
MSSEETGGISSGEAQLSNSPEISLGEVQSGPSESYGLEADLAQMDATSSALEAHTGRRQGLAVLAKVPV